MDLNKYLSPSEFEELCDAGENKKKVTLKRVYEKIITTPSMFMTLDGMVCHLFVFIIEIEDEQEKNSSKVERCYNRACPVNAVIGNGKERVWDILERSKSVKELNVTLSVGKNNDEQQRLCPFKVTHVNS